MGRLSKRKGGSRRLGGREPDGGPFEEFVPPFRPTSRGNGQGLHQHNEAARHWCRKGKVISQVDKMSKLRNFPKSWHTLSSDVSSRPLIRSLNYSKYTEYKIKAIEER